MTAKERFDFWMTDSYFDDAMKVELSAIADDEKEITERFYKDLEFGTGGLRGVIGAGTNRMNIYTVRKATQGLADYIISQNAADKGVAIAYDSRRFSPEFANEAALCLAANGIKAYVFDSLRPTPELSFALRTLKCTAGIVITASHNPPEYNGYKVYWEDGAQITAPKDKEIITCVNAITDFNKVKTISKEKAVEAGLYITIGKEIDDLFMKALKQQIIHPEIIKETSKDIKIVYSPFNGAGNVPVRRILKELGFENVYVVPEQEMPDPDFTTLEYPNPEDPKAFTLALKLAEKVKADVVLATDPDSDRLGVYSYDTVSGDYVPFNGNMTGMLIAEYILREKTESSRMPENPALVKTIVTTNLADSLAKKYGIKLFEVLTGFKYIGEKIKEFEQKNDYSFLFGLEESYGCLAGTHARDKDAVVAAMCLCEVAAWCKKNGITLWDRMQNIYKEYGYYKEDLSTITLKGIEGSEKIKQMMAKFRENPPKELGNWKVLAVRDYETGEILDLATGLKKSTGLPKSNVLYFELTEDAWCCVRPSGTEPKIKFYMGVKGENLEDSTVKIKELSDKLNECI